MKVLLIKDVKSLGKAGEVKEVKPGYGQNFLIKKGFAKPATEEILAQHKADEEAKAKALADEIATSIFAISSANSSKKENFSISFNFCKYKSSV